MVLIFMLFQMFNEKRREITKLETFERKCHVQDWGPLEESKLWRC